MCVLFSRELAKRGHHVTVYCSLTSGKCTDILFEDGVTVDYYDERQYARDNHRGILIAFKDPDKLYMKDFDKRFLWTADPTTINATHRILCDGLIGIGKWHFHELRNINIGFPLIDYIEPGIDKVNTKSIHRVSKQCLYASSPDRGLDYLEKIWPQVLREHPDATLVTTYKEGSRRTNEDMIKLYQQSDVLSYPCSGQERFCLTVAKAQIYGTIPCVIPHMALRDTTRYGVKCLKDDYVSSIIQLLYNEDRDTLRQEMMDNVKFSTWSEVVDRWEKMW